MLLGKGEARTCRRKGSHMPCSAAQPQEPPELDRGHRPFETLSPTACHGAPSSLAMPSGWVRAEDPLLPCPTIPIPTRSGAGLEPKPLERGSNIPIGEHPC